MLVNGYRLEPSTVINLKKKYVGKYEVEPLRSGLSFRDVILKFHPELDPLPSNKEMVVMANDFNPNGLGGKVEKSGFNQFWVTVYTD